jgi:hypothetical protein
MALPDARTPHCQPFNDGCFGCKSRNWRRSGGLAVTYPYGQDAFHNTTVREQIQETLDGAAKNGTKLEYVGGGASAVPTSALGV